MLLLAVLHLGGGKVNDGSLHAVSLTAVQIDIRTPHHHKALHPAAGVGLQEVQVAFLRHDGTAGTKTTTTSTTIGFTSQHMQVINAFTLNVCSVALNASASPDTDLLDVGDKGAGSRFPLFRTEWVQIWTGGSRVSVCTTV